MYTNRVFGTVKCVLFIEVSSFQGALNKGYHYIHWHRVTHCVSPSSCKELHASHNILNSFRSALVSS